MHSHELTAGRTFGIRFDPGESFFPAPPTTSRPGASCRTSMSRSG
jgi:hypothetical protein